MVKPEDPTARLSRRVYARLRQRTIESLTLTEAQIDALHDDAARTIKRDLKALVRYTDKQVADAIKKHFGAAVQKKRNKLVEEQIQRSARDGGDAAVETIRRLYGDDAAPFCEKSSSEPRRILRLLRPPESADE